MRVIGEVPRRENLSIDEFNTEYVATGRPVVVAGRLGEMPAFTRWNEATLRSLLGDRTYNFKRSSSDAHPDFRQRELKDMFALESLSFAEFLDRILHGPEQERCRWFFSGDQHFLYRVREGVSAVNPELAPLWPDVRVPALVPEQRLFSVWAWFSGQGVRTWLHYDNNGCENLNAQIQGAKQALLFPPQELDKVGLFPLNGANPATNCSAIDVDRPDLSRFPEYATAEAYEATVRAGDLLFIPVNWLHAFRHTGTFNVNVNFWWKPEVEPADPVALRERVRLGRTAV